VRSAALKFVFLLYRRLLSPVIHLFGVSNCIFLPTCSEYAYIALERHGWLRGSRLALARIARCHPMSKGGLDPVP
jgi:putative membrane protein insertion efficiency factor